MNTRDKFVQNFFASEYNPTLPPIQLSTPDTTQSIPFSEFGNTPGGQSIPFSETGFTPLTYGRGMINPDVDSMTQYMAGRDMNYYGDTVDPLDPGLLGGRGFMSENPYEREQYMSMESEPSQKRMTMTTSPRTPFNKEGFNSGLQLMNMGLGLLD